jgi:hypothetical protein
MQSRLAPLIVVVVVLVVVVMVLPSVLIQIKGDGVEMTSGLYNQKFGECIGCQYFPVTPAYNPGLKACIFDNMEVRPPCPLFSLWWVVIVQVRFDLLTLSVWGYHPC